MPARVERNEKREAEMADTARVDEILASDPDSYPSEDGLGYVSMPMDEDEDFLC